MSLIIFVNRRDPRNTGDMLSSPHNYFSKSFGSSITIDVHFPAGARIGGKVRRVITRQLNRRASAIVIGGGGLLGNDYFKDDISIWTEGPAPAVLWGAGHNNHDINQVANKFPDESYYSQLMPFSAIGLRDWGPGFSWVPCASCMHPELSKTASKTSGTLFLIHRDLRGKPKEIEKILRGASDDHTIAFNDEPAESLFGKLNASRRVVTNSYHAAYWASLLRKPVVAIGGGTKVGMLKHKVLLGDSENWASIIDDCPTYDNALEECRDANSDFNTYISAEFSSKRPRTQGKLVTRDPISERQSDFQALRQTLPQPLHAKVPKIVHFIFGLAPDFGGKPFNIMHYVAIRSLSEVFKPDKILFHCQYIPENEYFEKIRHLITINQVEAPSHYNGRELKHFAHKADIIRLQALRDIGGIYLDLDTITVKPLDFMLDWSFTIGLQGKSPPQGMCNAVIAASPGDPFLCDWIAKYNEFSADEWDRFSVKLPYLMWRSGKYSFNVEAYDKFHWPLWDSAGLKLMFEEDHVFPNAAVHHLWESQSFPVYFANEDFDSAVKRIKAMNSTYSRLATPYLPG